MGSPTTNPILHKIVETKKSEIQRISISDLPLAPKPISDFSKSLRTGGFPAIIAECKKMSPSAGIIREDYDPVSIAKIYEKSGARAISVLTDNLYFGGSLQDLQDVANAVNLPVIRKDFIIDKSQILEARAYSASAILLIVRILTEAQLQELYDYSMSLGMGVLVETHNREEVETALRIGADVIGINTRDLDHFKIYPKLIEELSDLIPKEKIRIGESGIHNRSDWENLQGKVDGFLVGSYFMKSPDIEKAYKDLFL
ncbi:indole-3-glycerol phosphate synthase TrpC [Leptospira sp. GIMC2001]|uniref:indole-3-glycerol phosphate synthase TrpC n=1 Tax=Leptospira sp. GIMC2001 TaxID=1513297 RepID=UPI00234B9825|nr:indole-3-glycerol phosphate synthase TrpC [Leptospira sp. GIMC2001]WCL51308.1 indole-3-glycerol phosphate synthase TrpC [Leptospira sp. GIMC2001]